MSGSLSASQVALLARASPSGVVAEDATEATELCILEQQGLLARHAAGIFVLTDAGRRRLEAQGPARHPPTSD